MASIREFQRAHFSIDSLPELTFEGFTDGKTWNGWVCPYFTHDVAVDVLEASQNNGYKWIYEAEKDVFLVSHSDDQEDAEPEHFEGIQINVNDKHLFVYGIGAYSWIWES